VKVTVPVHIVSVANQREHWAKRARRTKGQRGLTRLVLQSKSPKPPAPPLTVKLTRVAPRSLDCDNNVSALKAVRDGVADYLGVDDGDDRITWEYAQAKASAPRTYLLTIEISGADRDQKERRKTVASQENAKRASDNHQ